MSEQTIDLKKRRFLTKATSVVGAVGVGFVAWPFLSTWKPSAKTKAAAVNCSAGGWTVTRHVGFNKN